ncbi:unnamed protein product [Peronospora destructor]|uniref:CCHC-type domain-containing protein n=1 Tax=Peronospora destructor TaxID=86335 RepID=A0AAV0TUI5_9STRA|nr:unnamed protein product [Peronospora destructor]
MQRLLQTFNNKISPAQSMKLFTAPKANHRSWTDHFLYLTAVSDAAGTVRASTEVATHAKKLERDVINVVEARKESKVKVKSKTTFGDDDQRTCYKCGEVGHIRSMCPQLKKKVPRAGFTFVIGNGGRLQENHWVLDSGSSRHLVNDLQLLVNPRDCRNECLTAATDGGVLRITKQGSVNIEVVALGVVNTIQLLDVQYAANLERNIISYGKLEAKGCVLEYRRGRRVLTSGVGGAPVMDVDCNNNVLVVEVMGPNNKVSSSPREAMMAVLNSHEYESDSDVQSGTLMHFHRRLGHLCFDTIIKMAKDPTSAIRLTDTKRMHCLACAQGK